MPVVECKRVAVLGAAGGIGQPLSLLMKMNKCTTELALYDIANVKGVCADLSHCNTPVKVGGSAVGWRRQAAAGLSAANTSSSAPGSTIRVYTMLLQETAACRTDHQTRTA
jgi:hypothetical protein